MTPRAPTNKPRQAVKRTLAVVVMAWMVFYVVLPQWAKQKKSADLVAQVNPLLLLAALGLEIASLVAYSVLTRVTLPPEPRLHLFTVFRIQLSTKAVTNLVPGGSAAGGTLGYRLFTQAGVPSTAAGFAMATVGLGSAVVLNLMLWLALLISIPLNGFQPVYGTAAIVGLFLIAAAGAIVLLLMKGRSQAELVVRAVARHMPFVEEDTAARFVHQVADRLNELAQQPSVVRHGLFWATANWLLDAAALWVFIKAFGETLSPVNLIVAYGLAGVLAAIPLTPGGLGVVELFLPPVLVGFGVPPATATISVLCWRFAQFWLPIPFGAMSYASLKLGPLGRMKRLSSVRTLAHETGEVADRRVWDETADETAADQPDR